MRDRTGNARSRSKVLQRGVRREIVVRKANASRKPSVDKKAARSKVDTNNWRSGLERRVGELLDELGIAYEFEKHKYHYTIPATNHTYLADFKLQESDLVIETKGRLTREDRKKMVAVLASNPGLNLVMVFSDANKKIYKGSKTSYAEWCDKVGIKWLDVKTFEKQLKEGK